MSELDRPKLNDAIAYIDSWIDINFKNSNQVGLQVAIMHESQMVYSKAFGFANVEEKKKLSTQSTFRVASISKSITSTAIMQLVESKKISLDDTMFSHLPWFKSFVDPRVEQITIRQLLNHTAGIMRDGKDSGYWTTSRDFPLKSELIDFVKNSQLIFEPDTRFKYSNYGYGYLGMLIEKISKLTFKEYIKKNIIAKIGLSSTSPDLDFGDLDNLSTGYNRIIFNRPRKPLNTVASKALAPATGLTSNAENICQFFTQHFYGNNLLLKDSSKRILHHGNWDTGEENNQYGLGFEISNISDKNFIGHNGGYIGYQSSVIFDPESQLVVCVLANSDDTGSGYICSNIVRYINKFQNQDSNAVSTLALPTQFAGRFYSARYELDIIPIGNTIVATNPLNWSYLHNADELEIIDNSTLKIKSKDGYSNDGEVIKYYFNPDGSTNHIEINNAKFYKIEDALKQPWF